MTFISYAQNLEDVMLWRALKDVEGGFYIDIGAQDPIVDSVSHAFYERGWRGIHVEPTEQYAEKLRVARPDEQVIQCAISSSKQALSFYEFKDTGLSTASEAIASEHQNAGFECKKTEVAVLTLDNLLESVGNRPVHWLKLDVEGSERDVLSGWISSQNRPWILVIESTKPLSQEETHQDWEDFVLTKGYQYVYGDGLNRFYLSPSHLELSAAFRYPPNYFDNITLCRTVHAESRADAAESAAKEAIHRASLADERAKRAEQIAQRAFVKEQQYLARCDAYERELKAILKSASWQITKPLRWGWDSGLRIRERGWQGVSDSLASLPLNTKLRSTAATLASRIGERKPNTKQAGPTPSIDGLSPRGSYIYTQLIRAFEQGSGQDS